MRLSFRSLGVGLLNVSLLCSAAGTLVWLGQSWGQGPVTVSMEKDAYQVAENGKTLSIKIVLSAPSDGTVSVQVKTRQDKLLYYSRFFTRN